MEKNKVEIVETKKGKSLGKTAKIIAISCFSTVMGALLFATISDVTLFSEQIVKFIGGIIFTGVIFVFMLMCFAVSFILIFGFYLVKEHGFWPVNVAIKAFDEMMGEITFSSSQINTLITIRWSLLVICILCFIASIVSLAFRGAAIKEGFVDKNKHIKKFDVCALIFSVLGIAFASAVFLIFK